MLLLAALTLSTPASAQSWEPHPCRGGDPTLRETLEGGEPITIGPTTRNPTPHEDSFANAISSSHLAAPGAAPAADADPLIGDRPKDQWSCTYAAPAAIDGNLKTAWVEGAPGPGVGEVLLVPITSQKLEIAIGCSAAPEYFAMNNRPKDVEVSLLYATEKLGVQTGFVYVAQPVTTIAVALEDTPGWQPLPLPPYEGGDADAQQFVAITLGGVYPGSTYQDTCISEIRAAQ